MRVAHPYRQAVLSARLFGGKPEDHLTIHDLFDESRHTLPISGTGRCGITAKDLPVRGHLQRDDTE
jgi:hypothetical protein